MDDQLDQPFGSSDSAPFSLLNIVFTLFSQQIKYDDDDDDDDDDDGVERRQVMSLP